ncbi:MAG: Rieske (2Fe-2S) protein [Halobacterium sp.]
MSDERIAGVDDVPDDDSLLFTVGDGDEEREAILVSLSDGSVAGWLNYCMHWTDVELDTGDGAVRNGDVYLTDPDYEFVRRGGTADDPADLSTSRGAGLGF